jgi:hypothetical protein
MGRADDRWTGVLVLRAWVEPGGHDGLRVRITRTTPDSPTELVSSAAATVDGVCSLVRTWLEEMYGPPPPCDP